LKAMLTDDCDAMCRKRLGVLKSANYAGVLTTWMCESFDNTNTQMSRLYSSYLLTVRAPHSRFLESYHLLSSSSSPCNHLHMGLFGACGDESGFPESLTPLKMESEVGFPDSTIPSASRNATAAQNHHRASRMLFTAKDHSWINLLGMLSQEFRQSMEVGRAVSSTRGHRRLA
jgi:hypothetical protein